MLTLSIFGALNSTLAYLQSRSIRTMVDFAMVLIVFGYQGKFEGISGCLIDWSLTSNSSVSVDTEAVEPPSPRPMKPGWSIGLQMEFPGSVSSPYFYGEQYLHSVSLIFCLITFSAYGFHSRSEPEWLLLDVLFLFRPRNVSIRIFSERQWYCRHLCSLTSESGSNWSGV